MLSSVQLRALPQAAAKPAASAVPTWQNGVSHTREGKVDRYELPAAAPGVPSRIEVRHRLGGLVCPKLSVTDAAGQILEAHSEWNGFHRVVVATDAKTGLQTTFDPKNQTIDVTTPTHSAVTSTDVFIQRYTTDVKARQHVDAQGNSTYVGNYKSEDTMVIDPGVGSMPPSATSFVNHATFEETTFARGHAPTSQGVEVDQQGQRKLSAFGETSVSASGGEFTLARADGSKETFPLFIKPSA